MVYEFVSSYINKLKHPKRRMFRYTPGYKCLLIGIVISQNYLLKKNFKLRIRDKDMVVFYMI
jgi:hypothetical protein